MRRAAKELCKRAVRRLQLLGGSCCAQIALWASACCDCIFREVSGGLAEDNDLLVACVHAAPEVSKRAVHRVRRRAGGIVRRKLQQNRILMFVCVV